MDYKNMTIAQLTKENQALMKGRAGIKAEQLKLSKVKERKITEEAARKKVEAMNDEEKAVLKQVLSKAGNIKSEEEVGTPGTPG